MSMTKCDADAAFVLDMVLGFIRRTKVVVVLELGRLFNYICPHKNIIIIMLLRAAYISQWAS